MKSQTPRGMSEITVMELKAVEARFRRQAAAIEERRLTGQNATTRLRLGKMRDRLTARADEYELLIEYAEKESMYGG